MTPSSKPSSQPLNEVVVISAEEFQRLQGDRDGSALVAAIQATPDGEVDLDPPRSVMPVRDATLWFPARP